MMDSVSDVLRVCEWGRVSVAHLGLDRRAAIAEAASRWARESRLPESPVDFAGPDGSTLVAKQYVGVVEAGGVSLEIYPKLDARIVDSGEVVGLGETGATASVMRNLLWLLGAAGYLGLAEADVAQLRAAPMTYYDLFAYVLAKNLRDELEVGVFHAYEPRAGDLHTVRGRIDLPTQVVRNMNRFDRIACEWDEFTSDTAMNRVLKCACRELQKRVTNIAPARLLDDCATLLGEVRDVAPSAALAASRTHRWSRMNERFHRSYDMAVQLLGGSGYQLAGGSEGTFVFLLDMNMVFEAFVPAVLRARFGVPVETQAIVGHLFQSPRKHTRQVPDYVWQTGPSRWIGDAKYKRLTGIADSDADGVVVSAEDGRRLSPSDVRQVTVYAEMVKRRRGLDSPPAVAIFCPFVGDGPFVTDCEIAWNGSEFWLVPVRVDAEGVLGDAVPEGWGR